MNSSRSYWHVSSLAKSKEEKHESNDKCVSHVLHVTVSTRRFTPQTLGLILLLQRVQMKTCVYARSEILLWLHDDAECAKVRVYMITCV
jgi:hypothetical protein